MSKLTQAEASRIMFAHGKVVDLMRPEWGEYEDDSKFLRRVEKLGNAEAAFAELVATLTETE
jgi:hypothetical protein